MVVSGSSMRSMTCLIPTSIKTELRSLQWFACRRDVPCPAICGNHPVGTGKGSLFFSVSITTPLFSFTLPHSCTISFREPKGTLRIQPTGVAKKFNCLVRATPADRPARHFQRQFQAGRIFISEQVPGCQWLGPRIGCPQGISIMIILRTAVFFEKVIFEKFQPALELAAPLLVTGTVNVGCRLSRL